MSTSYDGICIPGSRLPLFLVPALFPWHAAHGREHVLACPADGEPGQPILLLLASLVTRRRMHDKVLSKGIPSCLVILVHVREVTPGLGLDAAEAVGDGLCWLLRGGAATAPVVRIAASCVTAATATSIPVVLARHGC